MGSGFGVEVAGGVVAGTREGIPLRPRSARLPRTVLDEQLRARNVIVPDGPGDLVVEHPAHSRPPVDPVLTVESVLEQHFDAAVVAAEHPVVERLAVVGIGARVQQEPGELLPLRVRRLVDPRPARPRRRFPSAR